MKKYFLFIAIVVLAGCKGMAQEFNFSRVTMQLLGERVTIIKDYHIERSSQWVYFDMIKYHGYEGWAFKIIDSTKNGIYVIEHHWITNFDSLEIKEKSIRLFNHTNDEIIYH